ncbi:MAG TPA: cytochrome c [Deltaproteobacteria bacterium]|nr:cytochrome c [Deltaproteobacteria bacterium]
MVLGLLWWAGIVGASDVSSKRPSDLERGETLYRRHCTSCHGSQARGDGPATAALVHPVPDLSHTVKADNARIDVVMFGAGAMPGFEASFDRNDARRVLKYMMVAHEQGDPQAAPPEREEPPEGEPVEDLGDGQQIEPEG